MSEKMSDWTPPSVEECAAMLQAGKEGVEKWNAMRKEHPEWKPDLRSQRIFWGNLSGADLSGADLSVADLSEGYFLMANFSGADLSGADLSVADLSGADLSGANLSGANLSGANLSGANLFNVNFGTVKGIRRIDWEVFVKITEASIDFVD